MRKVIKFTVLLFMFLFIMSSVYAEDNILNTFFEPFENLDIAGIYEKYSVVIDFLIYLTIFTGLSQVILSKKFQGRGGKALIIATGLVLSVGMITAEKTIGFNIKTFGPVAIWMFIILIAGVLFHSIKYIGAGNIGSGSIAFVVTYFIMRGLLPEFFALLQKNEYTNWLHSLVFIAVMIAMVRGFVSVFSGRPRIISEPSIQIKSPKVIWNRIFPSEEFSKEYEIIKRRLESIAKKDKKSSKEIISDLEKVKSIVQVYGENPDYSGIIKSKIYEIIPKEHEIFEKIRYLREVNKALENFDIGVFKSLKVRYEKLSEEEKELAKKEIKEEIVKVKVEKRIEDFASDALLFNENFKYCLKNAEINLVNGWKEEVIKWINEAIKYEYKIKDLLNKIREFEKLLEKITIEELKSIKKY